MGKHHRFAKDMLYELQHDIKQMLDNNVPEKQVYDNICSRLERDFRDTSYIKVEWDKDKTKPVYVKQTVDELYTELFNEVK